MFGPGTIKLVDDRDRTICTLSLQSVKTAESELHRAIARWSHLDAVGGYVHDETGKLLSYC